MLKNNKLKIVSDLEYPDHYQYSQKDFNEILNKAKKYSSLKTNIEDLNAEIKINWDAWNRDLEKKTIPI